MPGWRQKPRFGLILIAVLLCTWSLAALSPAAHATSFSDVPDNYWASADITSLYEAGVLAGRGAGVFAPEAPVVRAELAKMVLAAVKSLGYALPSPPAGSGQNCTGFSDVPASAWYYGYVKDACQSGIALGYGKTFGPNDGVTREAAVTMLVRAFAPVIASSNDTASQPPSFVDAGTVNAWARPAVNTAAALGILTGYEDGTLRPSSVLTRAEAAALVGRFWNLARQSASAAPPVVEKDPGPPPAAVALLGYATVDYEGDTGSEQSLQNHPGLVTFMANFAYSITGDGLLLGHPAPELLPAAQASGAKPLAVVSNYMDDIGGFSRTLIHTLLNSPAQQVLLINNIRNALAAEGYAGVNIDFENVPPEDRDELTGFLLNLATALQPQYLVTAALPAKTYDDPQDGWGGAFDYAAIGSVCDFVVIMTYDQHWATASPGPIASYGWVAQVADYAEHRIPPQKIMLGIAAYGYDWSGGGRARAVRETDIPALVQAHGGQLQWSSADQEAYYTYTADGQKHVVWVEDDRAVQARVALAQKLGFLGVAVWRLGQEDDGFWAAVSGRP